jgi:integrase
VVQIYPPLPYNYQPSSEEIIKALWSIRNLSKDTQKTYAKMLKRLQRETDLRDPEKVERWVFDLQCSNKTRSIFFDSYRHYCIANEIKWVKPNLSLESYPVKVPTEERINLIISTATKKYSTIFQISKYGLRPDEISKITLRDLDLERGELTVKTSKLGLERTLRLKPEARDLIKDYVQRFKIQGVNQRLFPESKTIKEKWRFYRNRAYDKFKDPELLKIRLYDLRHWFGTTSYICTRDIFHVKYLMGHRNIQSTLYYMHIAKGMINYSDEYTVKVANNLDEFTKLLESGFEYVSDYEGKKILRKRK